MVAAPAPAAPAKGRIKAAKPIRRTVVRFGLGAPTAAGDYGLVTESGMAWLVRALPDESGAKRRKDDDAPIELHLQRLMPADALRLRGRHNAANALAALALATAIGCPLAPMLHGLREYGGEPHRVQPVGRVGEVEAFDDSKGTNVGATVAALIGSGRRQGAGTAGGDPRRRRQGAGFLAAGRTGGASRPRSGADRPRRRRRSSRRWPTPACRCSTTPTCRRPCAGASSRRGRATRCC